LLAYCSYWKRIKAGPFAKQSDSLQVYVNRTYRYRLVTVGNETRAKYLKFVKNGDVFTRSGW